MDRPLRTSIAWLALLAYVLTGALWTRGLVLCFEPDGHVSLELAQTSPACSECCPEGEPDTEERSPGWSSCACQDVVLGIPDSTQKRQQLSTEGPAPRRILARVTPAPPTRDDPVFRAGLPRSHASQALRQMRGVVLQV